MSKIKTTVRKSGQLFEKIDTLEYFFEEPLATIVTLLSSILAGSLLYGNNITANVVAEDSSTFIASSISETNNFNELRQLNESRYMVIL